MCTEKRRFVKMCLVIWVVEITLLYSLFSFSLWDFNPGSWGSAREFFSFLVAGITFFTGCAAGINWPSSRY